MKQWLHRVDLYWHAPEHGWQYSRFECFIEICFMTLWTVMGEYREARHES